MAENRKAYIRRMLRARKEPRKNRKTQGKFDPLKLEVIPCFSPMCFSKIIQLLIRELGFTLSLVERQLNDNNDRTIVTIYLL